MWFYLNHSSAFIILLIFRFTSSSPTQPSFVPFLAHDLSWTPKIYPNFKTGPRWLISTFFLSFSSVIFNRFVLLSHAGQGFDRNRIPFSHTGDATSPESQSCIHQFILFFFFPGSRLDPLSFPTHHSWTCNLKFQFLPCWFISTLSASFSHFTPFPLRPFSLVFSLSKRPAPLAVACVLQAGLGFGEFTPPLLHWGCGFTRISVLLLTLFFLWSSFCTSTLNFNMFYPFIQLPLSFMHCSTSCHYLSSKSFTRFIVFSALGQHWLRK